MPDAVCELVEADMGRLSDEVAEALDLLAVARHLPARALVDLVGSGPIEEAERRSLIFADDAPEPVVRLVHPLYGEVRRTRMGRIRLRRLRGTVAGVLCDEDEPSPAELVRRGQLLIDSDVKPALDDLLTLAQAALWCGEFDVSLRFARRALLSGGGWKASIRCADALTMAGRSAEADAQLVGLDVDDLPPEGVKQLARARALSLLTQNRIPDALASVTGIDDSGEVDAVRALVLACAGRDSAAVAAADGALGTTGEPAADDHLGGGGQAPGRRRARRRRGRRRVGGRGGRHRDAIGDHLVRPVPARGGARVGAGAVRLLPGGRAGDRPHPHGRRATRPRELGPP